MWLKIEPARIQREKIGSVHFPVSRHLDERAGRAAGRESHGSGRRLSLCAWNRDFGLKTSGFRARQRPRRRRRARRLDQTLAACGGTRWPEMGAVGALERRRQDRTGGEPWGMAQFCFLFQCSTPCPEGVLVLFFGKGGGHFFSISKALRPLAMAKSRKNNKPKAPAPGARSSVWPDHIISSDEEEPVARESRDARTLDVIIREIVRGRPANIRGREALLIGDLSAHLY